MNQKPKMSLRDAIKVALDKMAAEDGVSSDAITQRIISEGDAIEAYARKHGITWEEAQTRALGDQILQDAVKDIDLGGNKT